jgi:hypothetical protein
LTVALTMPYLRDRNASRQVGVHDDVPPVGTPPAWEGVVAFGLRWTRIAAWRRISERRISSAPHTMTGNAAKRAKAAGGGALVPNTVRIPGTAVTAAANATSNAMPHNSNGFVVMPTWHSDARGTQLPKMVTVPSDRRTVVPPSEDVREIVNDRSGLGLAAGQIFSWMYCTMVPGAKSNTPDVAAPP